jgi:hypothetical protein
MALSEALVSICRYAASDVQAIAQFARFTEGSIAEKRPKQPEVPFTPAEAKQLRDLAALLLEATDLAKGAKSKKGPPKLVRQTTGSDNVGKFVLQMAMPIKFSGFLSEMTLTYLIAHQEAFIKDFLLQVFLHKRAILKGSSAITYEELYKYSSMSALWESIAQKEVDGLAYGGIDDVAMYF